MGCPPACNFVASRHADQQRALHLAIEQRSIPLAHRSFEPASFELHHFLLFRHVPGSTQHPEVDLRIHLTGNAQNAVVTLDGIEDHLR